MEKLIDPFAAYAETEEENTGGLTDPFAEFADPEEKTYQQERNGDVGLGEELWAAWGRGSNSLLSGIGTLYGVATGDMDNWAREQGERGQKYYSVDKSDELAAQEKERAEAIEAADGELEKAGAAVWHTISNPRLLANFIVEQAPMMVPGGAVGRVAGGTAKLLGAGTKVARGAATAGGVGAGAALQTGDVAGQTYDDILKMPDELWNQNPDYLALVDSGVEEGQAKEELALRYTREVAPLIGAASLATQALPGGRAIEKALAGSATKKAGSSVLGRVAGATVGEGAQEGLEEVSGQMLSNVAKMNVNPDQSVWEGTGEAGGLGALGGVVMGAPAGFAGETEGEPGPKPEVGSIVNYTDAEGNPRTAEVIGEVTNGTRFIIRNDDGTEQQIGKDLVSVRSDTTSELDDLLEEPANKPAIEDPVQPGPDPIAETIRAEGKALNDEVDSIVGGTEEVVATQAIEDIIGPVGQLSEEVIPLANVEVEAAQALADEAATVAANEAAIVERTATAVSESTGVDPLTARETIERVKKAEGEGTLRSKVQDETDVEADPVYVSRIVDTLESRMSKQGDFDPELIKGTISRWQANGTLGPREVEETAINDFLDGKIEAGERVTRQEIIDYVEDSAPRAEDVARPVAEKEEVIPAPAAEEETRPATVREAAQRKLTAKQKRAQDAGQQELFDVSEEGDVEGLSPEGDTTTGELSPEGDTSLDIADEYEEGFKVNTRRDGTVLVVGDVAAIRARLPGTIKGRPNKAKTGLLFSHTQSPRVLAAMRKGGVEAAGASTYGRAGQVLAKKPMKDGKYVGAPAVAETRAKIGPWRKKLKALAEEGEYGRHWYRDSAKAVMEFAGGKLEDAKVLIALMSIYSPQAKVDANTTFALRAWAQYKAGLPVRVKTGTQDDKAAMAIANDPAFWEEFWSGEKTGNFYRNLMKGIDPEVKKQGATIDLWMVRAGGYTPSEAPGESPKDPQYAFMEDETNRIARDLGWSPEEVQAAIWVALKARMENPDVKKETDRTSEAKGWISFKTENGKKVRVIHDEDQHSANWRDHGMAHEPDAQDKDLAGFHYGHGMLRHLGQVSWEPKQSTKLPDMRGVHTAPYEQQLAYFAAIKEALFPGGKDELASMLGILVNHDYSAVPGVWEEEVSPSGQAEVVMAPGKAGVMYTNFETMERMGEAEWEAAGKPAEFVKHPGIDAGQFKLLELYSAVLGLVLRQDGVGFHRMFVPSSKTAANAVEFKLERPLTPDEAKIFEAEIRKAAIQAMRGANVTAIEKAELARAKEANKETTDAATTPEEQKEARRLTKVRNAAARAKAASDAATLNDAPYVRKMMAKAAKDIALVSTADGIRVMNFGAIEDNNLFHKTAESVFETVVDPSAEVVYGYADGTLIENNWETSTNGQDYIQTINDRGRPDLVEYANTVLRPRIEQVNREFAELFGWGEPGISLDVGTEETTGGSVYGSPQEDSVSVTGVHFGRTDRTEYDSSHYGKGLQGAERRRLADPSADPRIKKRVYFYVDEGQGVSPEAGVGNKPHYVRMDNLYDAVADPRGLKKQAKEAWPGNPDAQSNELDRLIIENGFDGVYVPGVFGSQGVAAILGQHTVPVTRGLPGKTAAPARTVSAREQMADKLANSKLPGGRMRASAWAKRIAGTEFDSKAAQDALAARGDDVLYRSDLADVLSPAPAEEALELPTIEVEELTPEEAFPEAEEISYEDATAALEAVEPPTPVTKQVVRHNEAEKQEIVEQIFKRVTPDAEVRVSKLRPGQAMIIRAMERLLGKEIIVFEGANDLQRIPDGLASGALSDIIFVRNRTEQPVLTVIGHEFLHQIKNTNAALYQKILQAMYKIHGKDRILAAAKKQMERRNKAMAEAKMGLRPIKMEKAIEEVTADLVGASFADIGFWQQLAKETGNSFAMRLATRWQAFLQSTINFIKSHTPRAMRHGWVQDIVANNEVVLDALREMRETMPAEVVDAEIAVAQEKELLSQEELMLDMSEDTSMDPPVKTVKAYKLFRIKDGQLYPLFIDAGTPTPIGTWIKAIIGDNLRSKIGKLALRPGWHAGDLPIATHIGGKEKGAKAPTFRKPDQVWAEVELPADVDWQSVAESRATRNKKTGAIIPRTAEIKGEVPLGGHYRYKTNPNMTGEWIIGGGLKVNRILSDAEVKEINDAAGVQDLPRKEPLDLAKYGFEEEVNLDIESDAFKSWFGDSKVVSADGRPLKVYHGGPEAITAFDPKYSYEGAFFFSESASVASSFAEFERDFEGSPNVTPVYLKAERPMTVAAWRTGEQYLGFEEMISHVQKAKAAGYDSIKMVGFKEEGETATTWAVFEPNQIKSAIGNRGTFDPNEDDISLATGTPGWEEPSVLGPWERVRIILQNKYLPLLMVQDAIKKSGATIRQAADARNMQKRYPGIVKAKLVEFEERYLHPVQDFMRRTNHTAADIGRYLMARHIIMDGVNARLEQLNPNRQNNTELAGMSDTEAQAILNRYANDPDMQRMGRLVDRMNQEKVQLMIDEGLISQEEADRWRRAYQHYMPLMREDVGHTFAGGVGGGGFQQKGKLSKVRGGSHKALDFENALGSVFGQYEATLIRIEKNRVAGSLYQLALDNPNDAFWDTDNFPVQKKIVDGKIEYVPNTQDPGMIPFKQDGETKWVWLKTENEVAARLAKVWKNEDVGHGEAAQAFLKPLMAFMRYQSMINTALSPEFVISNFMRDLQTAGITMQDTELKGHTMRVMKGVFPSIKGIGEALFSNKPVAQMGEYAKLYKEMEKAGGTMGWIAHYENVEERTKAITKAVKRGRTKQFGMDVLQAIGDVNQAVENGVRLAAYKATKELLMEQGMTEADAIAKAAVVSRELTVDFQEKGTAGSVINAGYLFFNASVQGTFRLGRAALKSNRARLGLAAIATVSYVAHLAALMGDDDDEYKMISKDDRERNLIIPSPIGDGFIKIPLGWGLNVFGVIGQEAAEATLALMGEKPEYSLLNSAHRLSVAMLNAFNPINDGSLALTITPTVFDPFVKVTTNTDWHGGALFPDYVHNRADHLKFFRSSSELSQKITETLARWTTKSDGVPFIDVSPETVDMIYDTFSGSMGRFYGDLLGTGIDVATGDIADREVRKLPLVRKLWKEVEDSDKQRYAFEIYNEFGESYQAFKDNDDNKEWMGEIGTKKMRSAWNRYKRLNRDKTRINKRINQAVENGQEDREKELRKEKVDMMVKWVEDHHEIMYGED